MLLRRQHPLGEALLALLGKGHALPDDDLGGVDLELCLEDLDRPCDNVVLGGGA